jgi:glycosyltransferase involved in cell wall biosynthesis
MAMQLRKSVKIYDLLHLHGLYRFPTTYAAYLARKHKVPYIIEPHGSLDPFMFKQSAHNITAKRVYEKFFDLPNLNSASAIRFSSSEEKTRAGFLGLRPPGIIVPNGIDWKRFKDLPARGAIRQRIGMKDEPMILFLSRINL